MEVKGLGGDRIGSGSKNTVHLRTYERSNSNLSYTFKNTQSVGTLVPFLKKVMLPGASADIDINMDALTHPTIGPLFGSFKGQVDVYTIPIRLFNAKLAINLANIGLTMEKIKLPRLRLRAAPPKSLENIDNCQINPSCILSYLGMRGLGHSKNDEVIYTEIQRDFNAVTWLAYWDIVKNYYMNKQEKIGVVVHNPLTTTQWNLETTPEAQFTNGYVSTSLTYSDTMTGGAPMVVWSNAQMKITLTFDELTQFKADNIVISIGGIWARAIDIFMLYVVTEDEVVFSMPIEGNPYIPANQEVLLGYFFINNLLNNILESEPQLKTFNIENIDAARKKILSLVEQDTAVTFDEENTLELSEPYTLIHTKKLLDGVNAGYVYSKQSPQEGLAIKTYQSDLFNNWLDTETITGSNGINELTAVAVTDGKFTIDALNIANKIFNVLNRVMLSGGSIDDWTEAVYDHQVYKRINSPVYVGGLSKELVFQEITSTAQTEDQALGTLAGRGTMVNKKGGRIKIKTDEISYVIGLVSFTPRLDYSQGNDWDVNIESMDDWHKPGLDAIGFQDLPTDQIAWWDTEINPTNGEITYFSAGKQPSWIQYRTSVDRVYGNFAIPNSEMFMVLNRDYDGKFESARKVRIKDLTTYIDPTKYNNIFAYTKIDAMNLWVKIDVKFEMRQKMAAKQIPNL